MNNLKLDISRDAVRFINFNTDLELSEEHLLEEGYKKEDILEYLQLCEDIKSLLCDSHIIVDKGDNLLSPNHYVPVENVSYSIENGKITEVEIILNII